LGLTHRLLKVVGHLQISRTVQQEKGSYQLLKNVKHLKIISQ
jgi:hypothetical protein